VIVAVKEPVASVLEQEKAAQQIGSEMQVGISSFASWMLGVGSIIGSMAWLFHGPMIARAGTLASVSSWILAGFCMLPLCFIVMELASMFPAAGGPYVYKYYAFKRLAPRMGELFGFITGWLFWMAMVVGLACMSNGLANLLSSKIWGSAADSPIWFAPVIITLLFVITTTFNFKSVDQVARVNTLFSLFKFAMAITFVALVFFSPNSSVERVFQSVNLKGDNNLFKNIASVLLLALSGMCGIELTGCTSSETKDAQKTVPRAMIMTLISVTCIYALMAIAISAAAPYILDADKTNAVITGTNFPATCPAVAGFIGGSLWGNVFTACVVASVIGCGFGCLMTMARLGYSMAKTGLFPAQFAQLDPKTKVPKYALIFQFWCMCLIGIAANLLSRSGVFPDAYTFLAETFGVMYAFIALLYGVCAIGLRYTDPNIERPFRVGKTGNGLLWGLSVFTILIWGYAAFGCTAISIQMAALLILLAGIPIYGFYRWRPALSKSK
jgi:amino acid transporter